MPSLIERIAAGLDRAAGKPHVFTLRGLRVEVANTRPDIDTGAGRNSTRCGVGADRGVSGHPIPPSATRCGSNLGRGVPLPWRVHAGRANDSDGAELSGPDIRVLDGADRVVDRSRVSTRARASHGRATGLRDSAPRHGARGAHLSTSRTVVWGSPARGDWGARGAPRRGIVGTRGCRSCTSRELGRSQRGQAAGRC